MSDSPSITETVSVQAAREVEPTVRPPDPLALEDMRNNHAKDMYNMQRGIIGFCVGTGYEKSGNVATLTILLCFIFIGISYFTFDLKNDFDSFYKIVATMLGPIGLALGYLFGRQER